MNPVTIHLVAYKAPLWARGAKLEHDEDGHSDLGIFCMASPRECSKDMLLQPGGTSTIAGMYAVLADSTEYQNRNSTKGVD
jgi:hypothetical protein